MVGRRRCTIPACHADLFSPADAAKGLLRRPPSPAEVFGPEDLRRIERENALTLVPRWRAT